MFLKVSGLGGYMASLMMCEFTSLFRVVTLSDMIKIAGDLLVGWPCWSDLFGWPRSGLCGKGRSGGIDLHRGLVRTSKPAGIVVGKITNRGRAETASGIREPEKTGLVAPPGGG